MQISEVLTAPRRQARAAAVTFVAVALAVSLTVLPHGSVRASAAAIVQPTTANLGTEQYVLAVVALEVRGTAFSERVLARLPATQRGAAVTLDAQADQTTGIVTITAVGADAGATLAEADAAVAELGVAAQAVSGGVAVTSLSRATLLSRTDIRAGAVDALGLGAICALAVAIARQRRRVGPSRAQRLAGRLGIELLLDPAAGGPAAEPARPGEVLVLVAADATASAAQAADQLALACRQGGTPATVVEDPAAVAGGTPPAAGGGDLAATTLLVVPPLDQAPLVALPALRLGRVVVCAGPDHAAGRLATSLTARLRALGVGPVGLAVSAPGPTAVEAGGGSAPSGLPARLARNVLGFYGATALAGLAALVLTPYALHRLGRTAFGTYALLQSVSEYVLLANAGIGTATLKLVAEDAGRDEARVVRTVNTSAFVLCGFAVVALAGSLVASWVLPGAIAVPPADRTTVALCFVVLSIAIAPQLPGSALTGIIMGYQRYDIEGLLECAGIVVTAGGTALALLLGGGLLGAACAIAAGYLVMVVVPWRPARRLVPSLRLSPRLVDRAQLRRMTSLSGWYLVENINVAVGAEVDLLLGGLVLGVRELATFAIAFQLSRFAGKAIAPFGAVFFPHVSATSAASGEAGATAPILLDGTRVTLAIAVPAAAALSFLGGRAVHAWVGSTMAHVAALVVILTLAGAVGAAGTVGNQVLIGLGRARAASAIGGATSVVHIGAGVLLAEHLGAVGLALGSLVAVAAVSTPLTVLVACRASGIPLGTWARRTVGPHLPATAATVVLLALLAPRTAPTALSVGAVGAASFALYLATYLLTGASAAERSAALSRLRPIWRTS